LVFLKICGGFYLIPFELDHTYIVLMKITKSNCNTISQ